MANFKRLKYTEKSTGQKVRKLGVDVLLLLEESDSENGSTPSGLTIYCDEGNSVYYAKPVADFETEFVEGWLSKVELGLVEAEVEVEPETFSEKVKEAIDSVTDAVKEVVSDAKDIVEEIKEGAEDVADAIGDTAEDIVDIVTTDSESEDE